MSETLVETPINIESNKTMDIESNTCNNTTTTAADNSSTTITSADNNSTTTTNVPNKKPGRPKKSTVSPGTATAITKSIVTAISSSILTRGKKRAKETYDFMFGVIEEKDLLTLFGSECTGPNDAELRVYFHSFPKQDVEVITKQDLEKFINNTYTNDQIKSIDIEKVLKNVDLDESGEIEINDFVEYLEESIIEKSKSMGLIIELSSDEDKPKKKKRSVKKPVVQPKKVKKVLKKEKKESKTKKKVEKEKKSSATTSKKVKYNFEKYHNTSNNNTEDGLETEGANSANLGEGTSAMWQYQFNTQWLPYDEDAAKVVEEAYQEWLTNPYVDVRSIKSGSWCYQVDFKQMTQTNIQHQDHRTRSIRRILTSN